MLSPGTVLNTRFRLKEALNSNSVRQTWLAEDLKFKDQVVVKLLALSGSMDWDDLKLLEREAQILQQLDHPRLVRYRDYFAVNSLNPWFCLVTEYVPGVSLKERLDKRQKFTPTQIQWIAAEVLEILNYLHQLNPPVLHRDIKPSNLVWGTDNHIHLIDFGCVQIQPRTPGATFTVVGTYGYTPIEQFGGEAVPASDLYALGASLIHLLTGLSPSELPIDNNLQIQFRERAVSPIEPQFYHWLEKLIHPSVSGRYSNANQALIALNASISAPIESPENTGIRLAKSEKNLSIEIPSRFAIEYLRPSKQTLQKSLWNWGERLFSLRLFVKLQIVGVVALAGWMLWLLPLPLDKIGLNLISSLLVLPLVLLILGVPAGLILLILLLNSGVDYFERVSLELNEQGLEICWKSLGLPKRKVVNLSEIQNINLTQTKAGNGRLYPTLEIAIYKPMMFFLSQRKTYHLGQQLKTEELEWLKREMNDWLTSHSSPLPQLKPSSTNFLKILKFNQKTADS
ncbi:serine/threonine protein kinase [Capilliphycus salinus ALCB114379]|uniref:serine/threonine protein kinase n=1 Tax=Capilliphycus salinus TaxID=2768948 RepID=UPI0039A65046